MLWGLLSSELSQSLAVIGNGMFKHKAEQEANTSLSKSLCSGVSERHHGQAKLKVFRVGLKPWDLDDTGTALLD